MSKADRKAAEERVGQTLAGRYRLVRVLGTGGMGAVYEAVHTTTEKKVAIKLLAPHLSRDLKLVARFRREAVAASRLVHENCVHIDDFGEDRDGTFYIAMELVNGRGLADELRATGPMSPARVARIGVQLLMALDAAHIAGVLHRDLKPQNVMLTQKTGRPDIVKVVDFGIAKITTNDVADQQALTVPGTIFGTPEYMSPEQARGEPLDARSDLYSASVVLWHMLLGRSPFRGTSVRDTLLKVFSEDAPSPVLERPGLVLPPGFESVLRKGMAKNRDDRWPDAASYLAALAPYADGVVVDVPQRARPGLTTDGSPPPPTLEKLPAVRIVAPPQAVAETLTEPIAEPPVSPEPPPGTTRPPTAPASFPETRYAPAPASVVPGPGPSVLPAPPPPASPPPASPPPAPASVAQTRVAPAPPPPPARAVVKPFVPPGEPTTAKVVTLDSVRQQTMPAPAAPAPPTAPARRMPRLSVAAMIVIGCGVLALAGFATLAVLVMKGTIGETSPPDGTVAAPPPAPPSTPTATKPPTAATDATTLQKILAGDAPIDPLARDAALGRAERAVSDGRTAEARRAFEEALAADPTTPAALAGLGILAMQQRDWATARDCFAKLIAIDATYRRQFGPMYARAKKLADAQPVP